MNHPRGLEIRKRAFQLSCITVLALLVVMEVYSLAAVGLDRFPSHRHWWEYCGIALSWVMLAVFVAGFAMLLSSRRVTTGFRLVIANIAVFYGFIIFDLFADQLINKVSFFLLAIYSGIALVEMFAAIGLRKLAPTQTLSVDLESE
jgi:hypothetical protein